MVALVAESHHMTDRVPLSDLGHKTFNVSGKNAINIYLSFKKIQIMFYKLFF